jgi:hypothetical protein
MGYRSGKRVNSGKKLSEILRKVSGWRNHVQRPHLKIMVFIGEEKTTPAAMAAVITAREGEEIWDKGMTINGQLIRKPNVIPNRLISVRGLAGVFG